MSLNRSYEHSKQYRKMRKEFARDNCVHLLVPCCPDGRPVLACSRSSSDIDEHNMYLAPLFMSFSGRQCKECLGHYYALKFSEDRANVTAGNLEHVSIYLPGID
jgi:hypothetical protein